MFVPENVPKSCLHCQPVFSSYLCIRKDSRTPEFPDFSQKYLPTTYRRRGRMLNQKMRKKMETKNEKMNVAEIIMAMMVKSIDEIAT